MPSACRNCGEPVTLEFCPRCGQRVESRRGPLLGLLGDFFSEFFSLDGRHLRTAAALFRPGRLTRRYLEGRRASYVSPVRVYLVASLLFFLLVGFPAPDAEETNVLIDDHVVGGEELDPKKWSVQLISIEESSSGLGRIVYERLRPKLEQLKARPPQELLDSYFGGFERTLPTTLIVFVPFLALAIRLLYLRSPFYYVDHLVFALHHQSFLFVGLVVARGLNWTGLERLAHGFFTYLAVFLIVAPVYLAVALRRVYGQSWLATLAKTLLLQLLYFLLSVPVVTATLFLVVSEM